MDHNYHIDYKNIQLRPLRYGDISLLREWRNDSKNSRYLKKIPYITQLQQEKWFESYLVNKDEIFFAVVENDALHRVVGSLALYNFDRNQAEFGKILIGDHEVHGKKIGVHAVIAALICAFDDMKLDRVYLKVYKTNGRAINVYKQSGFSFCDTSFSEENRTEEYEMEMLRKDFVKQWLMRTK